MIRGVIQDPPKAARDDRPLHDPEQTPAQVVDPRAPQREQTRPVEPRAAVAVDTNDLLQTPPPLPPAPSSPDRTGPVPVFGPLSSGWLAPQNPPNWPQPRSEFYTPLEVVDPHDTSNTATTSLFEIGTPMFPPSSILLITPLFTFLNFDTPAFGFLIRRAFGPHELPLLIHVVFSSRDESDIIHCLRSGDDAQTFVDVIDKVCFTFARHCETKLADNDTQTPCPLGTGCGRTFATSPEEMPQVVVQGLWSPRTGSEGHEDSCVV